MLPSWIRVCRFIFGLLAFSAALYNLITLDDPYFWRFFTNQSSVLAGTVLVLGALFFSRVKNPAWWDVIRGIAVISMLVTGIVYAVLLDGLYNPFTTTEHTWASSVMHQLLPIIMLIDILLVPLGAHTRRWTTLIYPLYPLAYLGWFLIRGKEDGWYPYDFIDHSTYTNGYTGVLITCGGLLAVFIIIGLGIISYSQMRRMPASFEMA